MKGYVHFDVTDEGMHTAVQLQSVSLMDQALLVRCMLDTLELQGEHREKVVQLAMSDTLMDIMMHHSPRAKKEEPKQSETGDGGADLAEDVPQSASDLDDALAAFGAIFLGL